MHRTMQRGEHHPPILLIEPAGHFEIEHRGLFPGVYVRGLPEINYFINTHLVEKPHESFTDVYDLFLKHNELLHKKIINYILGEKKKTEVKMIIHHVPEKIRGFVIIPLIKLGN